MCGDDVEVLVSLFNSSSFALIIVKKYPPYRMSDKEGNIIILDGNAYTFIII